MAGRPILPVFKTWWRENASSRASTLQLLNAPQRARRLDSGEQNNQRGAIRQAKRGFQRENWRASRQDAHHKRWRLDVQTSNAFEL